MKIIANHKHLNKIIVFILLITLISIMFSGKNTVFASSTATAVIPVNQIFTVQGGTVSSQAGEFKYIMTPNQSDFPMPDGSSSGAYHLTLSGTTNTTIEINYTHAGAYLYTFKPDIAKELDGYTYDKEEYTIGVYVKNSASGLITEVTVEKKSDGMKAASVEYTNNCKTTSGFPVNFRKTDESGKKLSGAVMSIKDSSGIVIMNTTTNQPLYTWTTDGNDYTISNLPDGEYFLSEQVAPSGYHYAPDIAFEVSDAGVVSVDGKTVDVVTMADPKIPQNVDVLGKIQVEKTVYYDNELLAGDSNMVDDTNMTFYAALFEDENLTKKVSEIVALDMRGVSLATAIFEGLPNGSYYVAETDEFGTPVDYLDDVAYLSTVDTDGAVEVSKNTTVTVPIRNDFEEFPDGYYIAPEETDSNDESDEYEEEEETDTEEEQVVPQSTNASNDGNTSETTKASSSTHADNVFTGDNIYKVMLWLLVFILTLIVVITIVVKRKNDKDE